MMRHVVTKSLLCYESMKKTKGTILPCTTPNYKFLREKKQQNNVFITSSTRRGIILSRVQLGHSLLQSRKTTLWNDGSWLGSRFERLMKGTLVKIQVHFCTNIIWWIYPQSTWFSDSWFQRKNRKLDLLWMCTWVNSSVTYKGAA